MKSAPKPAYRRRKVVSYNRLAELRAQRGLSMRRVAALCQPPTTASHINKLEKGLVPLTEQWLYRLAPAFHCEPMEILEKPDELLKQTEWRLLELYRKSDRELRLLALTVLGQDGVPVRRPAADFLLLCASDFTPLLALIKKADGRYEMVDYRLQQPIRPAKEVLRAQLRPLAT
jgi:transcriptional regulator with XRE-family HTH domain